MSEEVSGMKLAFRVSTEGEDNLTKLVKTFEEAQKGIDSATLAMMERIEQFDKKLASWGKAAAAGNLKQNVAEMASDILRQLDEAARDIQQRGQLNRQTTAGRTIADEIAARQNIAHHYGHRAASLVGRGDIWTAENTPAFLPDRNTPMEQRQRWITERNARSQQQPLPESLAVADPSTSAFFGSSIRSGADQNQLSDIRLRLEREALERRDRAQALLNEHNAFRDIHPTYAHGQNLYGIGGVRIQEQDSPASWSNDIRMRLEADNAERIRQQQAQIASQTALRPIYGSQDTIGLAEQYRSLANQRTQLLGERDNGRDVTAELNQIRVAMTEITRQMDFINAKGIDLKLGGPLREVQALIDAQREFIRDRDLLKLDHQQERVDLTVRQATERRNLDEDLRLGRITPDQHAVRFFGMTQRHDNETSSLNTDQATEQRIADAQSYSSMRGSSFFELEQRRRILSSPNTPQTAETLQALQDINAEIRSINQNQLNIRVGGDARQRLQEINDDLGRVTGEYSRIQLERERDRINRANQQQRRVAAIQARYSAGDITEDEYNRLIRRSERAYDRNEQRIGRDQRQSDFDNGFIDRESGRLIGNQRGVYGNNTQDRRLHYQISNAAFGIDDAIQSYQYDGIRGAVRGASNNVTALLSTMNFSPLAMGASVVAASLGSVLIPKIIDTGREVDTTEKAVARLNAELDRLGTIRSANFGIERGTADSSDAGRKTLLESRKAQREKRAEVSDINRQIEGLGAVGPAGELGRERLTSLERGISSNFDRLLWNTFTSDSFTEDEWFDALANDIDAAFANGAGDGHTDPALAQVYRNTAEEIRRERKREKLDPLQKKKLEAENQANALDDSKISLAERQSSIQSQLGMSRNYSSYLDKRSFDSVDTQLSLPSAVEETMTDLADEAARTWRKQTEAAREALVSAGASADTLDIFDTNAQAEYEGFYNDLNAQIRSKVESARKSLERLNQKAEYSDIFENLSSTIARRDFDFRFGKTDNALFIDQEAKAEYQNRRRSYEVEQQRLADAAIREGRDPKEVAKWMAERMRKFDLDWSKWIEDKVDAVAILDQQRNPHISEDLRTWLGKSKNADFLAQTGIGDLADPNLRMHEQEQEYWRQVRQDKESADSQRAGLRSFLDPRRALEENMKKTFEKIDDMQIDLFDKVLLKEAEATKAAEEFMNQGRVTNTNTATEMDSQRVAELQQQSFNRNERIPTTLDAQLAALRQIHQSIERQRNLRPTKIFKMI